MEKQFEKLISVITVCLNAADYIEKTLQSVSEQTCPLFEYLVIDGKSTDKTLEIVGRYQTHIDRVISEKDGGIYAAMNKAVNMAGGKWTIFLNAGDVFCSPSTLSDMAVCLQQTSASLVYGDIMKKDKQGQLLKKVAEVPHNAHRMFFCHQALFCKTSLLLCFPFDEKYRYSADFKFVKSMWLRGESFLQTDIPVAVFDTTGISNTSRAAGLKENIRVIKELDFFFDRLRLLPKLYFTLCWLRIRGKA